MGDDDAGAEGGRGLAALADGHLARMAGELLAAQQTCRLGQILTRARLGYHLEADGEMSAGVGVAVTARLRLVPEWYHQLSARDVSLCTKQVRALLHADGYGLQRFLALPDATTPALGVASLPTAAAAAGQQAPTVPAATSAGHAERRTDAHAPRRPASRVAAARPGRASRVDVDLAAQRYLAGWTLAELAGDFGVSASHLSTLLPADVKRRATPRRGRPRKLDVDLAARRYLEGWTLAEVAAAFGVTAEYVRRVLPADVKRHAEAQHAKRQPPPPPGSRSRVDVDLAARRYLEGWSLAELAAVFDVSRERVRQVLPDDVKRQAKQRRRHTQG